MRIDVISVLPDTFSAVTTQELGRLLFRHRITKRESGIVGAIAVLCYVLVLLL